MSLGRALATIGGWTIFSRLTGLVRDQLIAHYLGAGTLSDAFFVAFRFPNLFRSLFAEGAFNAAFVPLFGSKLESGGPEAARVFAEQCYSVLAVILVGFVALIEIAMPLAMYGLAAGFAPDKFELAIELSRITFPYLLFIALVSLQSGVLNAMGHFAAAAGTPVLLNVTSIAVLLILAPYAKTPAHAMAWGVFVAGIVQFVWLYFSVRRIGMGLHFRKPSLPPEVRLLLKRVVPAAVGAGMYQINLVINTFIASFVSNGAISYLAYADRINQLPLGVVGIAMGTALLPLLGRQVRAGEIEAARESQNRGMELSLLLTLPATLALMALARPIIAVIFEHGSFLPADTPLVAQALVAYATGLPAYVLVKVLTPAFFAREDIKTPVRVAMATMALNIALNLLLMRPLGHIGLALSTSIAAWINVAILAWLLKRRGFFFVDARLKQRAARIFVSGLVMVVVLLGARLQIDAMFAVPGYMRIAALAVLIALGLLVYAVSALATGAARGSDLKAMFRRRRS
jgi:putative peptidoglycan lipid II flippase